MLSEKDRQRIIKEESEKFLQPGFGQVDFGPDYSKLPPEEEMSPDGDKYGFGKVQIVGGVNHFKKFLENPDQEALAQLAEQDPEIAAQVKSDRALAIAEEFTKRNPEYLANAYNLDEITDYLLKKHLHKNIKRYESADDAAIDLLDAGVWNIAELESAYRTLLRQGRLLVPRNASRNLTDVQRQQCAAMAANGDVLGAIALYVQHRSSEEVADELRFAMLDPESFNSDLLSDPAMVPILREALAFAWSNYRVDFSPTPERWAYIWRYVGSRFATVKLLDAAWESLKQHEANADRSALLNGIQKNAETGQPSQTLDDLTDEQIAELRTRTLREYAKQQRRR